MKLRSHYTVVFILALFFSLLQPQTALAGQAVWIDTDPACGNAVTDDVDDCWALLMALRSRALDIRGVSNSYGNVDGDEAHDVAIRLLQRYGKSTIEPPIYRGADVALDQLPPTGRRLPHLDDGNLTATSSGLLSE